MASTTISRHAIPFLMRQKHAIAASSSLSVFHIFADARQIAFSLAPTMLCAPARRASACRRCRFPFDRCRPHFDRQPPDFGLQPAESKTFHAAPCHLSLARIDGMILHAFSFSRRRREVLSAAIKQALAHRRHQTFLPTARVHHHARRREQLRYRRRCL